MENTLVLLVTPSDPAPHAALLCKVDQAFYHIKNTYKDEPMIKIPRNRATYYQWEFGKDLSKRDIIQKYSQSKIEWDLNHDDWYLFDKGYFLSFSDN